MNIYFFPEIIAADDSNAFMRRLLFNQMLDGSLDKNKSKMIEKKQP